MGPRSPLDEVSLADLLEEIERRRVAALVAAIGARGPEAPAYLEEHLAAKRYGLEPRALLEARKSGKLTARRVGRRVVLDVAELERFIASSTTTSPASPPTGDALDRAVASGRLRVVGGRR